MPMSEFGHLGGTGCCSNCKSWMNRPTSGRKYSMWEGYIFPDGTSIDEGAEVWIHPTDNPFTFTLSWVGPHKTSVSMEWILQYLV